MLRAVLRYCGQDTNFLKQAIECTDPEAWQETCEEACTEHELAVLDNLKRKSNERKIKTQIFFILEHLRSHLSPTRWQHFDQSRASVKNLKDVIPFLTTWGVKVPDALREKLESHLDRPLHTPSSSVPPTQVLTIYTDGSATRTKPPQAAIGVFVGVDDRRNISARLSPNQSQTIGRAELTAIIEAFRIADDHHLSLFTDSTSAMKGVQRIGIRLKNTFKKSNTIDLLQTLFPIIMDRKRRGLAHVLTKVKSHSGVPGNEAADLLAGAAISGRDVSSAIRALFATAAVGPRREQPRREHPERPKRPRMGQRAAMEAEEACRRDTIVIMEAQLRRPLDAIYVLVAQQAPLVEEEAAARKKILKNFEASSDDLHIRQAILQRQAKKAARRMGEDRRRRNSDNEAEAPHVESACRHLAQLEQRHRSEIMHAYFDETNTALWLAESTRRQLLEEWAEEMRRKLSGLHLIAQQETKSRHGIIVEEDKCTTERAAFSNFFFALMYSEESSRNAVRTSEHDSRIHILTCHEQETRCEIHQQFFFSMLIQLSICESSFRCAMTRNAEILATGLYMQHRRRLRQRQRPREPSPIPTSTLSDFCSREALFRALITTAESYTSPHLLLKLLATERLERRRMLLQEGMTRRCTTCKMEKSKRERDTTSPQETFDTAD